MENISKIIEILKKDLKKYQTPIVTKISEKKDPFKVLISCILSLRTRDETTRKASEKLFKLARNPRGILKLKVNQIKKAIYPVSFYKVKSKNIKEISKTLINNHNGKVPDDFNELLKLKGVGKKTASITMVYGHNKPDFIPCDAHVHVVSNRLGWVKTKHPDQTMDDLMNIIPKKYWYDLNNLFVIFGQNICLTVSPFCSKCPINNLCPKIGVTKSR